MDQSWKYTEHRKRKRRRREEVSSSTAKLTLNKELVGDACLISPSLYEKIFSEDSTITDQIDRYVAVMAPYSSADQLTRDAGWTLLPAKPETLKKGFLGQEKSTIQVATDNRALEHVFATSQNHKIFRNKLSSSVEVNIMDVQPLQLEWVFVDVDGEALAKHYENQKRFGGGFLPDKTNGVSAKAKGKAKSGLKQESEGSSGTVSVHSKDAELASIIHQALLLLRLVRQHENIDLSLPSHPITHAPFPPALITACEPVRQGLVGKSTRVVVNRYYHSRTLGTSGGRTALQGSLSAVSHRDDEDMSNEQFYSAVEDGDDYASEATPPDVTTNARHSSESSSDESTSNIVSLSAPTMIKPKFGVLSSKSLATPRPNWSYKNGASTPGSVFSTLTASGLRQANGTRSATFKVKCLSHSVPDELLHPRPSAEEDEDARVFVTMKALLKVGCFSGDWVKVHSLTDSENPLSGIWATGDQIHDKSEMGFRPAKIFALPDVKQSKPSAREVKLSGRRRSSTGYYSKSDHSPLTAWCSPSFLYNLANPSSIQISTLGLPGEQTPKSRPSSARAGGSTIGPPIATEVTLSRIASPLSTERDLQSGIYSALKTHFEHRSRVQKRGDIVVLLVDTNTDRILSSTGSEEESAIGEMARICINDTKPIRSAVWFRIDQIVGFQSDADMDLDRDREVWDGAVCIKPSRTRMKQTGTEQSRIPAMLDGCWQSFYDLERMSTQKQSGKGAFSGMLKPYQPFVSPLLRRVRELMAAATSPYSIRMGLEPTVICLHSTQRGIGKKTLAAQAASDLGIHCFEIDAYDIVTEGSSGGDVKSEAFLKARFERALTCGADFTAIVLRHAEVITADRMIAALGLLVQEIRILIMTTTELGKVPGSLRSLFSHELEVTAPDEGEREGILRNVLQMRGLRLARDTTLSSVAIKTAAMVAGNLVDIVDRASSAQQNRLESLTRSSGDPQVLVRDLLVSGGDTIDCISAVDLEAAVEATRKNFADAIGAPKIPSVTWDDVGGLQNVKEAVMETIQLPLERPELFASGMKKRSGILFYGPPGTGKTLLAKAIATEFSLNFFSVKGPELLNMYIGESEANVRRVFERARDARPCVVFFDELDSVAPKRGNQGDSGGVMDRIVSQLLAELDGMSDGKQSGGDVFVIGATNRPDLLDQALLRPGRFDKMLYLGISDTHEKQLTIIKALTRKFQLHPGTSLRRIAEALPLTYTGADLYALCSDAMLKAITRKTALVEKQMKNSTTDGMSAAYYFDHLAQPADIAITVTEDDFEVARRDLVGSVSATELEHYLRVRRNFEGPSSRRSNPLTRDTPPGDGTGLSLGPERLPSSLKPAVNRSKVADDNNVQSGYNNKIRRKGKERATRSDSDDEDDDAFLTSNDAMGSPDRKMNGDYEDPAIGDDLELYG